MSDYTPITDFSVKDALASGDPEKVILGSDVDAELAALATAISSKANTSTTPQLASANVFTAAQQITNNNPSFRMSESDQSADERLWSVDISDADFLIRTRSDAAAVGDEGLRINRGTGNNVSGLVELAGMRIDNGVYTPAGVVVTNLDSVTPGEFTWMRIGNTVHCAGQVAVDPTSASAFTRFTLELPIASTLASDNCAGGGAGFQAAAAQEACYVDGVVGAPGTARVQFYATSSSSHAMRVVFQYEIEA